MKKLGTLRRNLMILTTSLMMYRNVHGSTRGFVSAQVYRIVRSSDHGDLSQKSFDHVSLSEEETRDIKKELDDIDNKFYEGRVAKLK